MELEDAFHRKQQVKRIVYLFILIAVLTIAMLGVKYYFGKGDTPTEVQDPENKEIVYTDYIYKIRYDFGCEMYIYLLKNNVIKTVEIQEIYEITPDCNCMESTGKFKYTEKTINYSTEVKEKVIKVFNDLYQKSGKKDFNADKLELTKYEQRVLLATVLDSEEHLTIEDNVSYDTVTLNTNSKLRMKNDTNNKVVNKIADYMNAIVDKEFDELNSSNMTLKSEFVYAGPFSLSFIYKKVGSDDTIYDMKGYTFYYNGDVHEYDMNGQKDKYIESSITNFNKSDIYLNHKDAIKVDYEEIIKYYMFRTGNWYLGDGKLVFLIPANQLLNDNTLTNMIIIETDLIEEF